MERKTWKQSWAEIDAACAEAGLPNAWGVRLQVANDYVRSGEWPAGEGLGSSDMNHILIGKWESEEPEVREVIARVAAREKLRAELEAAGVDLEAAARMFAPA